MPSPEEEKRIAEQAEEAKKRSEEAKNRAAQDQAAGGKDPDDGGYKKVKGSLKGLLAEGKNGKQPDPTKVQELVDATRELETNKIGTKKLKGLAVGFFALGVITAPFMPFLGFGLIVLANALWHTNAEKTTIRNKEEYLSQEHQSEGPSEKGKEGRKGKESERVAGIEDFNPERRNFSRTSSPVAQQGTYNATELPIDKTVRFTAPLEPHPERAMEGFNFNAAVSTLQYAAQNPNGPANKNVVHQVKLPTAEKPLEISQDLISASQELVQGLEGMNKVLKDMNVVPDETRQKMEQQEKNLMAKHDRKESRPTDIGSPPPTSGHMPPKNDKAR